MFVGCATPSCRSVLTGDRELIMQELSLAGWGPGKSEQGMCCPRCLKAEP